MPGVIFICCQDDLGWFKANTLSVLLAVWPPSAPQCALRAD